jgi:hypothetical protein
VVGGTVEREARPHHSAHDLSQRPPVRKAEGDVVEARRTRWRGRATPRLPRVQSDVVVVAPGGEERRVVGVPLPQLEPERITVEAEGTLEIRDPEVDMTDVDARIERTGAVPRDFGEQGVHVERAPARAERTVRDDRPHVPWLVAGELEPVTVRVAE